jgi:hypothetical protein
MRRPNDPNECPESWRKDVDDYELTEDDDGLIVLLDENGVVVRIFHE